jgi:solute carrier family 66, member 2
MDLEIVADLGMIFGPCVGYMIQTRSMVATESAEGFSPYVSFILIVSNLLRIFWYQVAEFSTVILYASLLMVSCQITLLYFWVTISNKTK